MPTRSRRRSAIELVAARSIWPSAANRADLSRWYAVSPRLRVRRLPVRLRAGDGYAHYLDPRFDRAAVLYARWRRPDLVYARSVAAGLGCAAAGIPTVVETHVPPEQGGSLLRRAGALPALRAVVTVTDALRDGGSPQGSSAPLVVWPDAVDRASARSSARRARWAHAARARLAIRLYDEKGVHLVGAAAAEGDACLGVAADIERVRAQARGCESVRLAGFVPNEQVPAHLAAADVLVLPNSARFPQARTTSPLKLFEYMAARRPIVATRIPALAGLLHHGRNAWTVAPDSAEALADGVERVLADPGSAGAWPAGLAGRQLPVATGLQAAAAGFLTAARTPEERAHRHAPAPQCERLGAKLARSGATWVTVAGAARARSCRRSCGRRSGGPARPAISAAARGAGASGTSLRTRDCRAAAPADGGGDIGGPPAIREATDLRQSQVQVAVLGPRAVRAVVANLEHRAAPQQRARQRAFRAPERLLDLLVGVRGVVPADRTALGVDDQHVRRDGDAFGMLVEVLHQAREAQRQRDVVSVHARDQLAARAQQALAQPVGQAGRGAAVEHEARIRLRVAVGDRARRVGRAVVEDQEFEVGEALRRMLDRLGEVGAASRITTGRSGRSLSVQSAARPAGPGRPRRRFESHRSAAGVPRRTPVSCACASIASATRRCRPAARAPFTPGTTSLDAGFGALITGTPAAGSQSRCSAGCRSRRRGLAPATTARARAVHRWRSQARAVRPASPAFCERAGRCRPTP
jgi:glycosyltransferase involved in cell wall biosynthesis